LVAHQHGATPIGKLVLVPLGDPNRSVELQVQLDEMAVGRFVEQQVRALILSRERRMLWAATRSRYRVPQPHRAWRPGQMEISIAVRDALAEGRPILVQAQTGLGKTAAILHAVLEVAFATQKQVFWATSRTTQQAVVEAAIARFRVQGLPVRSVSVSAKEKVCLNDVVACHRDRCSHARGYYSKVHEGSLVDASLQVSPACGEHFVGLGQEHEVCPFQLSLDASQEADVVIGDYNYVFDPNGYLRRHFGEHASRFIVVVDEVHQLVDRARGYGSPAIERSVVLGAMRQLEERNSHRFSRFLDVAHEVDGQLVADLASAGTAYLNGVARVEVNEQRWSELANVVDGLGLDYALCKEAGNDEGFDAWETLARKLIRFASVLEQRGEETVTLGVVSQGRQRLSLFCLDPSLHLRHRFGQFGGFVGCSATLSPMEMYRDCLGLPAQRLRFANIPALFGSEQLRVVAAPRVSTAFRDKERHNPLIAAMVERCVQATPGNVVVYFSSFDRLAEVAALWSFDDREVLLQERRMSEEQRQAFLGRLSSGEGALVVGAVLGGIFAEGIDLPPGSLSSVIIVGPAFPPIGLERELLSAYFEEHFGQGFLYASLVPGLRRVVQAAGRLVRREEDRGVVVLVGKRFRWREIQKLMPEEWNIMFSDVPHEPIASFWDGKP